MIEARRFGGFSLFNLWLGAGISLAEIMTGTLIAPLGIRKGIIVILVGHVIGCFLLALIGVIGFKQKKPSLISSRVSLGKYGSYLVSIFNIIQLTGWTAIMLIQCSNSVQAITSKLFGINNFNLIVIITGLMVALWALYADKGVNIINNIAVLLLLILSFVMLSAILKVGHIQQITDTISIGAALEFSIIMPLSWVPLISDYTMAAKSAKGSFFGSFFGYFIGSSFMFIIGLTSAYYTGNSDPISILNQLNMGYPALLIVILATVTTTFLDVYSASLSTLNLTTKFTKRTLIIIFTTLGTLLALVFPMGQYQNFLYIIGSLFAPIFSVIIIDYFIYKVDRSTQLLNVSGLAACFIGTFSYYIIINQNLPIGSTIPSMMITMFSYVLIRTVTKNNKLGDEEYVKQNS